jgi:RES domain-containing protein
MPTFFRIVQAHRAATAVTGEGARRYGGRWNPPGQPAVYLAESRALAALEVLVHAPREAIPLEWRIFDVEIPDQWIQTPNDVPLPGDWRAYPSSSAARAFGGEWLQRRAYPAIKLPSAIIPQEFALLLNPLHPDVGNLEIPEPAPFHFDPRL